MHKNRKNHYVCHRCALEAPTCCSLAEGRSLDRGGGHDCFPLSDKEQGRIAAALAKAKAKEPDAGSLLLLKTALHAADYPSGQAGWHVDEPNSPTFVLAMCNLFPKEKPRIKEIFPEGGTHMRLSLTPGGGCAFLSGHGCTLPRPARPWFCRVFPFWAVGGTLQCFQDNGCLAVREFGNNFMALMGAFDVSPHDIMERYKSLRRDWGVD